jgi:hypothetical protein
VATDEREKRRECDDCRDTTLSKKPRAQCGKCRRDGKVGRDDRKWRLCDEAHANNDRWRSSDDDSHDVGQTRTRANKQLTRSFASTDNATGVAPIIATTTTTAVIVRIAIATASKVLKAPTNATDATNATDMEAVTISQTADAARAAENAADAARTMTTRQMRPKRRDAVPSEGETLRDRDNDALAMAPPAKRAKKKPHRWHHRAQEAQDNVIESDDDVDLPAKLGKCSMGNDGLDNPLGLQLTGHTSRAGGDEETLVELSLKKKFSRDQQSNTTLKLLGMYPRTQ